MVEKITYLRMALYSVFQRQLIIFKVLITTFNLKNIQIKMQVISAFTGTTEQTMKVYTVVAVNINFLFLIESS